MAGTRNSFTIRTYSADVIREMESKIQGALVKSGLFVEGEAKLRCPVDTGNLKGSIVSEVVSDHEVQIGTDVDYAEIVEKGTSQRASQPYLTPAGESNVDNIKRIVEAELRTL